MPWFFAKHRGGTAFLIVTSLLPLSASFFLMVFVPCLQSGELSRVFHLNNVYF